MTLPRVAGAIAVVISLVGCNSQPQSPVAPVVTTSNTNTVNATPTASIPKEPPVWSPSDDDLQQLAPFHQIGRFEIQPPKSVRYVYYDKKNMTYAWKGSARADGDFTQFTVSIVPLTEAEAQNSPNDLQSQFLQNTSRLHKDWKTTPVEFGTINGLRFARTSWTAIYVGKPGSKLAGSAAAGIIYSAISGRDYIQIMCRNTERPEELDEAEIAAKTFRIQKVDSSSTNANEPAKQ